MPSPPQRNKSLRLVTTTPGTRVGTALESIRPQILPKLFDGLDVGKVSSKKGTINPRLLTLSDDLFTFFVSHHKVGRTESLSDRVQYKGFKAYATMVSAVTGVTVQANHDIRVIDVADILFVQCGFIGSEKLEACKSPSLDPTKVISIFHNNMNTMDFVVEDDAERKAVLSAIQTIREVYHSSKVTVGREELMLRYAWYDTDYNKSGTVDQSEFLQLLNRINIYLKQENAIQLFKDYAAGKHPQKGRLGITKQQQALTFEGCLEILRQIKLQQNGEAMSDKIFSQLFGDEKDEVTVEEFLTKFLHEKQGERGATIGEVKKVFSELNSMEISGVTDRTGADGKGEDDSIDRERFGAYLSSVRNDAFDPEKQKLDSSTLSSPLPEYWINSSHNTYLTGDQLKSLSSVEMYVIAMQRGCKCLELDCWDDSIGYPIVYHGYTLTSKIPFQGIITCVKGYIDANPDTLPIVLSLENHCSHPFQVMMAKILTDTLEDYLYFPDDDSEEFASPIDLKGKVVVKGKRPPETEEDELTEAESFEEGGDLETLTKTDPPPLPKIVPELARLTLFNGVKHKGFGASIDQPLRDMHSFSESKMLKVLSKDPVNVALWREYNEKHMTRTYPAGSRVDSSNYNPILAWHVGSQLVALNFQTDDSPMNINDGRFRENGGCGYIRKPPGVRLMEKEPNSKMVLKIKVLCGSCLPKPYGESVGEVIDPYVIVRVHDVGNSGAIRGAPLGAIQGSLAKKPAPKVDLFKLTERKTKSLRDNGFSPQWDSEYFKFAVDSDVAMVEFIVMDSDKGFIDDCMCKSAVPVSSLRPGIRCLQFYDQCSSQHGPFEFARVLVDVDIKKVV